MNATEKLKTTEIPYESLSANEALNHDQEIVNINRIFEEYFAQNGAENSNKPHFKDTLTASDMDGTLFIDDLGISVFLEKLSEPTFWTYGVERFRELLLPNNYRRLIESAAQNNVHNFPPKKAQSVLKLREDIWQLYKYKKQLLNSGEINLTIDSPVIEEFACKMIAFDRIIMNIEEQLKTQFEGQLLMRVRFFAQKNKQDVERLTKRVMERQKGKPGSIIKLSAREENKRLATGYTMQFNQEDLSKIDQLGYGENGIIHQQSVQVNERVRRIIATLGHTEGSSISVVTTNLQQIARTAIINSIYQPLIHNQDDRFIASTLELDQNGAYGDKLADTVYGVQKAILAEAFATKLSKKHMISLGDSLSNDGPMGIQALVNGGLMFIITDIDKYEQTRNKHQQIIEEIKEKHPDYKRVDTAQRMLYIPATKRK